MSSPSGSSPVEFSNLAGHTLRPEISVSSFVSIQRFRQCDNSNCEHSCFLSLCLSTEYQAKSRDDSTGVASEQLEAVLRRHSG